MFKDISTIIETLTENNLTIASCESVTAGTICSLLASVPGASKCFVGGFVVYNNHQKHKLVGVVENDIFKYGAISKQVAQQMAMGTRKKTKCDIAIAITGNAGPDPQENKKVGIAYGCILVIDKMYDFELISSEKTRTSIINDFALLMLNNLLIILKKISYKNV